MLLPGIIAAIFLRRAVFMEENAAAQLVVVLGFGYLAYIISELCDLSGVMSLLICGSILSQLCLLQPLARSSDQYWVIITLQGQSLTVEHFSSTFQGLSLLAEGFIFVYLGLSAFSYATDEWSLSFVGIQIGILFLARFCGIYLLSGIAM